jgi:hypothetical protein
MFLFVITVTNQRLYQECLKYIHQLVVPEGYEVDVFPIYNARSMTEGYNRALQNQAKYKLYIHQDTFILKKDILYDLLTLFQENEKLGLLGMIGCTELSSSGIWWEGRDLVGKIIGYRNNQYINIQFKEAQPPYSKVESLDGFFLATQYDIPWREEIEGFHFYDASQALEFIQAGYEVGAAYQPTPWTAHVNKEKTTMYDKKAHKKCQRAFLELYKEKDFNFRN